MPDRDEPLRRQQHEDENIADRVAEDVSDPGDSHRKGYSADPLAKPPVRDETIPVADDRGQQPGKGQGGGT